MLVLGLDPGLATTGFGLVRKEGASLKSVSFGVFTTPADLPFGERLLAISEQFRDILDRYEPAEAAVEQLFFARNRSSALKVAHARGVLLLELSRRTIPWQEYSPRVVKQGITGSGSADKPQMQQMVQRLLGLSALPRPDDAADALALAIVHCNNSLARLL